MAGECITCHGVGTKQCPSCHGTGRFFMLGPIDRAIEDGCDACDGRGKLVCHACAGIGHLGSCHLLHGMNSVTLLPKQRRPDTEKRYEAAGDDHRA